MEIANYSHLPPGNVKKILNEFTPTNGKATGNEIIKEFLFQKDVAAWFRGTSHYHIKGANKLFNALRDDGEQGTTHRVRTCLALIGLKPMIASKQIRFLMQLSRGNDLVFLWFLMEQHYKTPKAKPCDFSQNEQLICSAICHLDMVTTLRELDKILPRGQISDAEIKKKCLRRQDLKAPSAKGKNKVSPYFTKYTKPQPYGKCLFLEQPNFRVNFKYYRHFNNPNYTVQNESNRWYANYHFSPGKRVVHSIIHEIIKNIFYGSEIDSLMARSDEVLCGYHKHLKAVEADLKHELIVKARDVCLRQTTQNCREKEEKHANNIKNCFYDAVQQQMYILSQQTKTAPKNYTLKTITSNCKLYDVILGANVFSEDDFNTTTNYDSFMKKQANQSRENYIPHASEGNKQRKDKRMTCGENFEIALDSMQNCGISCEPHKEQFNDARDDTLLASCDGFFERPLMHQPYKFNYHKIFANFNQSEESGVRKIIAKALRGNTSNLTTGTTEDRAQPLEEAVETYEAAEGSCPLNRNPSSATYNAENTALLDQILFEAFQYLRKNPKFVWAQLPDAHKVPFLREWIAHRFGKEYTPAERGKSYRRSCLVFRALERSHMKLSVPNSNSIGRNLFVDYNCRKHVARKVQQVKSQYYHSLDCHLLEHTRVFWFAMRGYICSNGPPRKSFYAYMPSRLQDIQHFCLWKSSECRNNWNAWNIRRKKGVL